MPDTHRPGAGILKEDPGALSLRPDLAARRIWAALADASQRRDSPWRTPVLATVSADGAAEARMLVLRAADEKTRRLELHSDSRSGKAASILAHPRVALCFWNPQTQLQLRVSGAANLCDSLQRRASAWARIPASSRQNYQSEAAPGNALPEGSANGPVHGLAHFAILEVTVQRLEWLWLGVTSHQRGLATWSEGRWAAVRLTP